MENRKTLSLIFLSIVLISCNKPNSWDCAKSSGKISTEKRSLTNFFAVKIYKRIHLRLIQDSLNFLEIKAGKNLLPKVSTEITNDTLVITNKNKCNFMRNFTDSIIVVLHFTSLNYLRYESSGDIISVGKIASNKFCSDTWNGSGKIDLDLNCNDVSFAFHTGPGDLDLKGSGKKIYLYCAGQGYLNAEKFISEEAQINSIGSGGIKIYSTKSLSGDMGGEAMVEYYGNPGIVAVNNIAKGKLIKK
ncbi:MAG: head GIN domain-containing protein [Bacteroidota bacterium]